MELSSNVRRYSKQELLFCTAVLPLSPNIGAPWTHAWLCEIHSGGNSPYVRYFISTHRLWWWTSHYGNPPRLLPSPSVTDCHYLFATGVRQSYAEIFKKILKRYSSLGALGLLKKENTGHFLPGFPSQLHYLTDAHSSQPSSFQEKNVSWINANSGSKMNIQQPPKKGKRETQWNFRLNIKQ